MFNESHITKDGKRILIAEMETSHLLNMIRYKLRQLLGVVEMAHGSERTSEYKAKLYGRAKISETEAAEIVRSGIIMLAPYFAESFLRLTELVNDTTAGECESLLKQLAMRDGKIASTDSVLALPDGSESRVDWGEGDFEFIDPQDMI